MVLTAHTNNLQKLHTQIFQKSKAQLSTEKSINSSFIFKTWRPLAFTWLLMSVEGPIVAAFLARGADPKYNLAAFGVSFSLCLLFESPIIMMMSASLRLVEGKNTFLKLRNFSHTLSLALTVIMALLLLPGPYAYWSKNILNLNDHLANLVHKSLVLFLPWPGFIGFRRFYQGILIRHHRNKIISFGTTIRFATLVSSFFVFSKLNIINGVPLAALSMSLAVISEALFIRLSSKSTIDFLMTEENDHKISYKEIISFYHPLALTALIGLSAQPITSFSAIHATDSLKALAVLPFLNSFIFFFKALCLSFQEVILSLVDKHKENYTELRNFALGLGSLLSFIFFTLAWTPLNFPLIHSIFGFSKELTNFVIPPLQLLVVIPGLTLYVCWMRSNFISQKKTLFVTYSSASEVSALSLTLYLLIQFSSLNGAYCIAISLVLGRTVSSLCLYSSNCWKNINSKENRKQKSLISNN